MEVTFMPNKDGTGPQGKGMGKHKHLECCKEETASDTYRCGGKKGKHLGRCHKTQGHEGNERKCKHLDECACHKPESNVTAV